MAWQGRIRLLTVVAAGAILAATALAAPAAAASKTRLPSPASEDMSAMVSALPPGGKSSFTTGRIGLSRAGTLAQEDGCDLGFGHSIVSAPTGGGISSVVRFSAAIDCASAIVFEGQAFLVNRVPLFDGQIIAEGSIISGGGFATSTGIAPIPFLYPGGEQVEDAIVVIVESLTTPWDDCFNTPGVRIFQCSGIGTHTLVAIAGGFPYDSKKRPPVHVTLPTNPRYTISAVHSGKCLDVNGAGTGNGANVDQWDCISGATNEQWRLVPVASNTAYNIVAVHSGKCLDVNGAGTGNGANVDQWDCISGATNEQWRIYTASNGMYYIVAVHSGKCLDVNGGANGNGADVDQWDCIEGATNELWRISPVP